MSQVSVSLLDTVTRIYKNSSNEVIAIHTLSITEDRASAILPTGIIPSINERRKRSGKMTLFLTKLNLTMSSSRVIDKIQMIGGYDEYVLNGSNNDILSITYYGRDE